MDEETLKTEEELEEEVEDLINMSRGAINLVKSSTVIDTLEELDETLELIRRVYKKRKFDVFDYDLTWCLGDEK